MTHPLVRTTIVWNIIQIQNGSEELWLTLTQILGMCTLWSSPLRYDLGSRSWHILWSWTISVWNIIKIQLGSEELWSGHFFGYVCTDLELGDMTLGQGHNTLFSHGQQLCEILSWSNLAVRSFDPDTDFSIWYVCIVTSTLEIWSWVKVKYYPDRASGYEVMARTRCEQSDRQMDRVIPIYMYTPPPPHPPQLCLRGINIRLAFKNIPEHRKRCIIRPSWIF